MEIGTRFGQVKVRTRRGLRSQLTLGARAGQEKESTVIVRSRRHARTEPSGQAKEITIGAGRWLF